MNATLQSWARALGGEVSGDQVLCPGPGHSPKDRSLSVKIGKDGQPVVSFVTLATIGKPAATTCVNASAWSHSNRMVAAKPWRHTIFATQQPARCDTGKSASRRRTEPSHSTSSPPAETAPATYYMAPSG